MPDGGFVTVPDHITRAQAEEDLRRLYPEAWMPAYGGEPRVPLSTLDPSGAESPVEDGGGDFLGALRSGLSETAAGYHGARMGFNILTGDPLEAEEQYELVGSTKASSGYQPGDTATSLLEKSKDQSISDTAGDAAAYAGETIASSVGAMSGPLAVGGLASYLGTPVFGALVGSSALFTQHFTNNMVRQIEVGNVSVEDVSVLNAALAGAGQTAGDMVTLLLSGLGPLALKFGSKTLEPIVSKAVADAATKTLSRAVPKALRGARTPGRVPWYEKGITRIGATGVSEGLIEGGQLGLEQLQTPGEKVFGDTEEVLNTLVAGAVGGTGMATAGQGASALIDRGSGRKVRSLEEEEAIAAVEGRDAAPRSERTDISVPEIETEFNDNLKGAGFTQLRVALVDSIKGKGGGKAFGAFDKETYTLQLALDVVPEGASVEEAANILGRTFNHEKFHALERMGVVKAGEGRSMRSYAKKNAAPFVTGPDSGMTYFNLVKKNNPDMSDSQASREAAAMAFADFVSSPRTAPEAEVGILRNVSERLVGLGRFLRGQGFKSSEEVFKILASPEAGARWASGKSGNPLAMIKDKERLRRLSKSARERAEKQALALREGRAPLRSVPDSPGLAAAEAAAEDGPPILLEGVVPEEPVGLEVPSPVPAEQTPAESFLRAAMDFVQVDRFLGPVMKVGDGELDFVGLSLRPANDFKSDTPQSVVDQHIADNPDDVFLGAMKTLGDKRQGLGTKALTKLMRLADDNGVRLLAIPSNKLVDTDRTPQKNLESWYRSHGLKPYREHALPGESLKEQEARMGRRPSGGAWLYVPDGYSPSPTPRAAEAAPVDPTKPVARETRKPEEAPIPEKVYLPDNRPIGEIDYGEQPADIEFAPGEGAIPWVPAEQIQETPKPSARRIFSRSNTGGYDADVGGSRYKVVRRSGKGAPVWDLYEVTESGTQDFISEENLVDTFRTKKDAELYLSGEGVVPVRSFNPSMERWRKGVGRALDKIRRWGTDYSIDSSRTAKFPILEEMRRQGGVRIGSDLWIELNEMDPPNIGGRRADALFNNNPNAKSSMDQFDFDAMELFSGIEADFTGAPDANAIYEAIDEELRGRPILTDEQANEKVGREQEREEIVSAIERLGLDIESMTNQEVIDAIEAESTEPILNAVATNATERDVNSVDNANRTLGNPVNLSPATPESERNVPNERTNSVGWGSVYFDTNGDRYKGRGGSNRVPVVVKRGTRGFYGAAEMESANEDIKNNSGTFSSWQEVLDGFFAAMAKNPVNLSKSKIYMINQEQGRVDFIWDEFGFEKPVVVVLQEREVNGDTYYSVTTLSMSGEYTADVPLLTNIVTQRFGEGATTRSVMIVEDRTVARRMSESDKKEYSLDNRVSKDTPEQSGNWRGFEAPISSGTLYDRLSSGFFESEKVKDLISQFRFAIVDSHEPIRQLVEDWRKSDKYNVLVDLADTSAYVAAIFSSRANSFLSASYKYGGVSWIGDAKSGYMKVQDSPLEGTITNKAGDTINVYEKKTGGFVEILRPLFIDPRTGKRRSHYIIKEFFRYSQYKRGSRLANDEGKLVPLSDLPGMKKDVDSYLEEYPEIAVVHEMFQAWNSMTVEMLVRTEVLTEQMGRQWLAFSDYIPFYMEMDGGKSTKVINQLIREAGLDPQFSQFLGGLINQKPSRKFFGWREGPGKELMDPLEAIAKNQHAAISSGIRNVAALRTIDLALQLGIGKRVTSKFRGDPDVVAVRRKGKEEFYRVDDPALVQSMMGDPVISNFFARVGRSAASGLRSWATKNPEFMLRNLMRDTLSVYVVNGSDVVPIRESVRNVTKNLYKLATAKEGTSSVSREYEELEKLGALGGYDLKSAEETLRASGRLGSESKKLGREFHGGLRSNVNPLKPLGKIWQGLGEISDRFESSTREAVFEDTVLRTGSEIEGALHAIEVLNFGRHGNNPHMQVAISIYPFLNSRIQGLDVFARAHAGTYSAKKLPKRKIQQMVMLRGMSLTAATAAYTIMHLALDDDRYKLANQNIRDDHWIFPMPMGIPWFMAPTPFEAGIFYKTMPELITRKALGSLIGNTPDSLKHALVQTLAFNIVPQAVRPGWEVYQDSNPFTGRPINNRWGPKGDLIYLNTREGMPEIYKFISKAITTNTPVNIGPLQIEHLVRGYFATLGAYSVWGTDEVMRNIQGLGSTMGLTDPPNPRMPKRWSEIPFIRRFFADDIPTGGVTTFYEGVVDPVENLQNAIRNLYKEERFALSQERGDIFKYEEYKNYVSKELQRIRVSLKEIGRSDFDDDLKASMRDNLLRERNELTRHSGVVARDIERMSK